MAYLEECVPQLGEIWSSLDEFLHLKGDFGGVGAYLVVHRTQRGIWRLVEDHLTMHTCSAPLRCFVMSYLAIKVGRPSPRDVWLCLMIFRSVLLYLEVGVFLVFLRHWFMLSLVIMWHRSLGVNFVLPKWLCVILCVTSSYAWLRG